MANAPSFAGARKVQGPNLPTHRSPPSRRFPTPADWRRAARSFHQVRSRALATRVSSVPIVLAPTLAPRDAIASGTPAIRTEDRRLRGRLSSLRAANARARCAVPVRAGRARHPRRVRAVRPRHESIPARAVARSSPLSRTTPVARPAPLHNAGTPRRRPAAIVRAPSIESRPFARRSSTRLAGEGGGGAFPRL